MIKKTIEDTPEIPSTVNINGVDYDPAEVQSLIDVAKHTQELEKQWDTPVDKVWPEYGKSREEVKSISAERDAARAEIEAFKAKQTAGVEQPADIRAAQDAARKLGIILKEDLDQSGFIRKEDLPSLFTQHDVEQAAINKILSEGSSLEKEIDGSDGRPAFNRKVVLAYANAYNIPDLKNAYEDMNQAQLDKWKSAQVESQKAKSLKTLGAGGLKPVKESKVTDDNVKDLLHEQLMGGE